MIDSKLKKNELFFALSLILKKVFQNYENKNQNEKKSDKHLIYNLKNHI